MRLAPLVPAILLAGALSACAGVPKQPADPAVIQKITDACAVYETAKAGIALAGGILPGGGTAIAVVEAFVDPVCADPAKFAGDLSTADWILKNAAELQAAAKKR